MIWRAVIVALLTAGYLVPATAAATAADDDRVFTFRDTRITESSGLVDLGGLMVTTNDSGNPSLLFVVDPTTGRTVGVVHVEVDTVDVEALAPAGGRVVWAGDIGDNRARRRSVSVYRVPVRTGRSEVRPAKYRLVYPRGSHNAESLFVDAQGRVHVVTKSILGGTVYRAPLLLSRSKPNRLVPEGRVIEYATDAAMLPDGRHVVVRGPQRASVYTVPGFERLGTFDLPRQRQGEGISVGPGSRIRLSTEGVGSAVRQVAVPADIRQRMQPADASPTPSPSVTASASPAPSPAPSPVPSGGTGAASPTPTTADNPDGIEPAQDRAWLRWTIPGVILLGAAGIGFGLRRRSD